MEPHPGETEVSQSKLRCFIGRIRRKCQKFSEIRTELAEAFKELKSNRCASRLIIQFFRLQSALNFVPYDYDGVSKRFMLSKPLKRALWFFFFVVVAGPRCLFILCLPFFSDIEFRAIDDNPGVEDINMFAYIVMIPFIVVLYCIIWSFITCAEEISSLLSMSIRLDHQVSRMFRGWGVNGKSVMGTYIGSSPLATVSFPVMPCVGYILTIMSFLWAVIFPNCITTLSPHVCSNQEEQMEFEPSFCTLICMTFDSTVAFYGVNVIVSIVAVLSVAGLTVLATITHARRLSIRKGKYYYPQVALLMNKINQITRPILSWLGLAMLIWLIVMGNCLAKLGTKGTYQTPRLFFITIAGLSLFGMIGGYLIFSCTEIMHEQSVLLLASFRARQMAYRKAKRRRRLLLGERRPNKRYIWMPIMWEIGSFYRIGYGAAIDFLHNTVEHTFNAMVLV